MLCHCTLSSPLFAVYFAALHETHLAPFAGKKGYGRCGMDKLHGATDKRTPEASPVSLAELLSVSHLAAYTREI